MPPAALLIIGLLCLFVGCVGGFVSPLLAVALFPIAAICVVGYAITDALQEVRRAVIDGSAIGFKMNTNTHRQCPVCREIVRIDAARCKHCTSQITPPKAAAAPPAPLPEIAPTVPAPRQVNPQG